MVMVNGYTVKTINIFLCPLTYLLSRSIQIINSTQYDFIFVVTNDTHR